MEFGKCGQKTYIYFEAKIRYYNQNVREYLDNDWHNFQYVTNSNYNNWRHRITLSRISVPVKIKKY